MVTRKDLNGKHRQNKKASRALCHRDKQTGYEGGAIVSYLQITMTCLEGQDGSACKRLRHVNQGAEPRQSEQQPHHHTRPEPERENDEEATERRQAKTDDGPCLLVGRPLLRNEDCRDDHDNRHRQEVPNRHEQSFVRTAATSSEQRHARFVAELDVPVDTDGRIEFLRAVGNELILRVGHDVPFVCLN